MGLIITSEIYSDGGNTSSAYVNIQKYTLVKDKSLNAAINLYLNIDAREKDEKDTIKSKMVSNYIGINNIGSPGDFIDLNEETIYKFAYIKVKEYLESKGLTVEDSL